MNHHQKPNNRIILDIVKQYNFGLSMRTLHSFRSTPAEQSDQLNLAVRVSGIPALVRVDGAADDMEVSSVPTTDSGELRKIAEWVLFAELDLKPFYRVATKNSRLKEMTRKLFGLKPMRPSSLFEMAHIGAPHQAYQPIPFSIPLTYPA